jgi:hypothetical protein
MNRLLSISYITRSFFEHFEFNSQQTFVSGSHMEASPVGL